MHRGDLLADGTIAELRRLEELPVRMRLRVDGGWSDVETALPEGTQVARGEGRIDLTCPEPRKMEVIRRLAAAGPAVQDMEITPPTLDDLYAHFLREGERGWSPSLPRKSARACATVGSSRRRCSSVSWR